MSSGIHALETTYYFLFVGILMVLGIMLFLCLLRAFMGPTVADRLVSINMMGTMVMVIIATLAVMMEEGYLVDICIIYAMISFLAVIVLSKVIMGVKKEEEVGEAPKEKKFAEELLEEESEKKLEELEEELEKLEEANNREKLGIEPNGKEEREDE